MSKITKLILTVIGLIINIIVCYKLIHMCDTISDKWLTTWLGTTILAYVCAIFAVAWITETLINWKNK